MAEDDRRDNGGFFIWIILRIIFSIIIVVIVVSFVFNFAFGRTMPMMYYPDWLFGLFAFLLFIWVVSWIFRPWHYGYFGHAHEMRILRRRLARGEISEAEFKRKMKILKESHKY